MIKIITTMCISIDIDVKNAILFNLKCAQVRPPGRASSPLWKAEGDGTEVGGGHHHHYFITNIIVITIRIIIIEIIALHSKS